ncbi:aminotransferase class IV [Paracoccus beibuensis]|uniref:aminotransferase class IV n=1 Tax=Paracoccus beibuensis TaxID=547602 RepID=UPI00223FD29A|nr:aminotransferase class IV [Paracoccus beibuensis]
MQVRIPGPIPDGLTIFETMRAEADGRIALWPLHLARLRRGCAAVGFPLSDDQVLAALETLPRGTVLRARLAVDALGGVALTHAPLPPNPAEWRVVFSALRLKPDDPWLAVKSSHRPVYDAARAALPDGADEALLLNSRGQPCEGTITSLFVPRDGLLLTPPLKRGLLPGVLRESLLRHDVAREADLDLSDLGGPIFFGNALRGLIPSRLIWAA